MGFTEEQLVEAADARIVDALETARSCVSMLGEFIGPYTVKDKAIHEAVSEIFAFEGFFMERVKAAAEDAAEEVDGLEDAVQKLNAARFLCVESGMRIASKLLGVIQEHKLEFPEARKIQFLIKQVFDTETLNLGNA